MCFRNVSCCCYDMDMDFRSFFVLVLVKKVCLPIYHITPPLAPLISQAISMANWYTFSSPFVLRRRELPILWCGGRKQTPLTLKHLERIWVISPKNSYRFNISRVINSCWANEVFFLFFVFYSFHFHWKNVWVFSGSPFDDCFGAWQN